MKKLTITFSIILLTFTSFAQTKQYIITEKNDTVGYKNPKDSVFVITKPVLFWENYTRVIQQLGELKQKEEITTKALSLVNGNGIIINIPVFLYLLSQFHYTENK